jgi:hypothetical protein
MKTTAITAFQTTCTSRRNSATTFLLFIMTRRSNEELVAGQRKSTRKESPGQ